MQNSRYLRDSTTESTGSKRVRVRVKVPRQRDQDGHVLPHKHRSHRNHESNSQATTTMFTEATAEPVDVDALTGFSTITSETTIPTKTITMPKFPEHEKLFSDLEDPLVETPWRNSRFIQKEVDEDWDSEPQPTETRIDTILILTSDAETMLSTTQLVDDIDSTQLDFASESDPFFVELDKELKKEAKLRKIENGELSITALSETMPDKFELEIEEINPGDLYPTATCPPYYQKTKISALESQFAPISEPEPLSEESPRETQLGLDTILVTATTGSAEFIEANESDSQALRFIEVTATDTIVDYTVTESESVSGKEKFKFDEGKAKSSDIPGAPVYNDNNNESSKSMDYSGSGSDSESSADADDEDNDDSNDEHNSEVSEPESVASMKNDQIVEYTDGDDYEEEEEYSYED